MLLGAVSIVVENSEFGWRYICRSTRWSRQPSCSCHLAEPTYSKPAEDGLDLGRWLLVEGEVLQLITMVAERCAVSS